ncbi:MAG TPA: hypothetical protein VL944_03315 [Candidatus Acidoferrum sp.]|nr:hypothetical protein [Candidatus Acidoferrum sp.]
MPKSVQQSAGQSPARPIDLRTSGAEEKAAEVVRKEPLAKPSGGNGCVH